MNQKNKSNKTNKLFENPRPEQPVLCFSPTAWAKLLFFRDRAETEIAGFGITQADDLLYIEEFATVKQEVTTASFVFDDAAVADFFDQQVDASRKPAQFARILIHTHPGDSPTPSGTDEENFQRVFGGCEWAVMFILAQAGKTYARLRFNVGPGGEVLIPVQVDFSQPFSGSGHQAWEAEYQANIQTVSWSLFPDKTMKELGKSPETQLANYSVPNDWLQEFETMEPAERQYVLDELAARPDLWEESGVGYDY